MRRLSTMCSAFFFLMTDIFTMSSPAPGLKAGASATLTAWGAAACGGGSGPESRCLRMSSFVTRPAIPVPKIREISTLCSLAILRTSGDDRCRTTSSIEVGVAECWGAAGDCAGVGACFGSSRSAADERAPSACGEAAGDCGTGPGGCGVFAAWPAAALSTAGPMTATTLLTGTVSPSLTRISVTTPAAGDGISASTLSVEISKSGSSRSTLSPTFLIQRTMVPSAIDSPICGITTSVAISRSFRVSGDPYMCIALPWTACAASPTASAIVGCAWMV